MRLALRPRSTGFDAADVDHALTEDRSLVVSWLNRGTLHLVRREDYWWLHALTTPRLRTGNMRRLGQEGVPPADAERGVAAIGAALAANGPMTRAGLRDSVAAAGVRVAGQALVHLLFLAALRGIMVRGPVIGGELAFVRAEDWIGAAPQAIDRDAALGELALRYLAGHGPAGDSDLAKWAGIGLTDARHALAGVADRLDDLGGGLADLSRRPDPAPLPPPRVLGSFDPVLHGWTSREPVLGPHTSIVTTNGLFRPFTVVAGRATGTWTMTAGTVAMRPLEAMPGAVRAELERDARRVGRYLDRPDVRVTWPAR